MAFSEALTVCHVSYSHRTNQFSPNAGAAHARTHHAHARFLPVLHVMNLHCKKNDITSGAGISNDRKTWRKLVTVYLYCNIYVTPASGRGFPSSIQYRGYIKDYYFAWRKKSLKAICETSIIHEAELEKTWQLIIIVKVLPILNIDCSALRI